MFVYETATSANGAKCVYNLISPESAGLCIAVQYNSKKSFTGGYALLKYWKE